WMEPPLRRSSCVPALWIQGRSLEVLRAFDLGRGSDVVKVERRASRSILSDSGVCRRRWYGQRPSFLDYQGKSSDWSSHVADLLRILFEKGRRPLGFSQPYFRADYSVR